MENKYIFLLIMFLFIFGACCGWCIEVLYRKFFSDTNPEHKWLNPGLTTGPWLPIYGFGTVFLFLSTYFEELLKSYLSPLAFNLLLFLGAAIVMSLMELIGGLFLLKFVHLRLWDYRNEKGNYKGVICPKFFCIWGFVSVGYYYLISDVVVTVIYKYFANLDIFTFFVGLLWGIFLVDLWHALGITRSIKKYAKANNIVIQFETVKQEAARQRKLQTKAKKEKFFVRENKDRYTEIIDQHIYDGRNIGLFSDVFEKARKDIEPIIDNIDKNSNKKKKKI